MYKAIKSGPLKIGSIEIDSAVLDNPGTPLRVLSTRGVTRAIGGKKTGTVVGAPKLPPFLASNAIKPFISDELMARLNSPVEYAPLRGGRSAFGYDGELLVEICKVVIAAKDAGALRSNQLKDAAVAQTLIQGIAVIGIISLIDEATGYQDIRDRVALQAILDQFLRKEWAKWAKRFPDEFYQNLFALRGWQYSPLSTKRPGVIAHWTNDIVYERLAPGVLDELKKRNPPNEHGHRPHKHHQWLTEDVGHPALREHLSNVIFLMKAAPNWATFYRLLQRAKPKQGTTLELKFPEGVDA